MYISFDDEKKPPNLQDSTSLFKPHIPRHQLFPFVPTTVIDPKLTNFRIFQRSTLARFDSTVQSHEDCGLFIIINTHIFSDLKKNHNPEIELSWPE